MLDNYTQKRWYQSEGNNSDVVISTRIRLARNLNGYPFPHILSDEQKTEINNKVKNAILEGNSVLKDSFEFIEAEKISKSKLASLVERHLVSPDFARYPKGRALLLMKDESVSIMLNEEDHVRIQVMCSGMELEKAYDMADKIDTLLDETLSFAFDEELGYLTACPTNLGTGIRASVMVHLPAVEADGTLKKIAGSLGKIGAAIRGSYGEGSEASGALYQISNQVTLGISEKDTVNNLNEITNQIIALEKKSREKLLKSEACQDSIWRALGIMKSARIMSSKEFAGLYSTVRMGVAEGAISGITLDKLSDIFAKVQPANLIELCGENMTAEHRDRKRAELIRNELKDTEIS